MTTNNFRTLLDDYYRIEEAIILYDSGTHPEYDYERLCEALDDIHETLCYECSQLASKLINEHKEQKTASNEEIHFLNVLFDKALMCKEFADPECSGLNNEYGSGLITCHGTDFYVPDNLFMKDFMDYYHFQNLLMLWKIDEYN